MITMPIELYTDGSCLRNPGPGGYGYIIRYWELAEGSTLPQAKEIEHNQGFRLTTNNRMEILSAIEGLKRIIETKTNTPDWQDAVQINVFSDSEYLCNAINQRWINRWAENNWMTSGFKGSQPKPVKNKDLWDAIIKCQEDARNVGLNITFTWVKGHDGHEFNERCDKLAVAATNGTNHIIDEEYEKSINVMNRR